ncbi:MAG: alpha/beta fold hydrolase [Gemmatales bacterium]|nr:alpha/beta fold hydrolase [Gemmatales bacterium]MDW8386496.1 alpha/beta fold hydrolase [Gemmatales bacterium]
MSRLVHGFLVWLIVPGLCVAQTERLELGKRLRKFEAAWDAQTDAARRKAAVADLQKAVQSFFSFRLGEAGKALDEGRFTLTEKQKPSEEKRWAESLHARLSSHFLDTANPMLKLTLAEFYTTEIMPPEGAAVRLTVRKPDGMAMRPPTIVSTPSLPQEAVIDLKNVPAGDYELLMEVLVGQTVFVQTPYALSLADKLSDRLARLKDVSEKRTRDGSIETETLRHLVTLLGDMAKDRAPETDYPCHRLLEEAERLAESTGEFYTGERSGQFWLALAVASRSAVVRLQVPEGLKKDNPVPLVVALHGAGGSENLFFDGYGNGAVARLCKQRGWLLVAPRLGVGGANLSAVVEELAKRYPVDRRRVFLVGHSMGAGQALAAVSADPEKYAAVAALGGGGAIRRNDEAIRKVPFFIGVGSEDFALRGAQALRDSLTRAEVKTVEYKLYPDIEHLIIVQVALPDVFAFFDRIAKQP